MSSPIKRTHAMRIGRMTDIHHSSMGASAVAQTRKVRSRIFCPGFGFSIYADTCEDRRKNIHLPGISEVCESCVRNELLPVDGEYIETRGAPGPKMKEDW